MRMRLARLTAGLPPVRLARRLDMAQAIRVFGTLLSSGSEASRALQIAGQAAAFDLTRVAFSQGARRLREGCSLPQAFAELADVPLAVVTLLAVGEQTGQAGQAALRAAQLTESEARRQLARWLAVLNPAAVLGLGAMIAVFIAAVMLGILSINRLALQ